MELLQDPNTTMYSRGLGTDADSMIITRLGGGREDEKETRDCWQDWCFAVQHSEYDHW